MPVGLVSLFFRPRVDQLPLPSTLGFVSVSFHQFLGADSHFFVWIHLGLLAREDTGLHLGSLLLEQSLTFAH